MAGPGLMSVGRRFGEEPACSVMIVRFNPHEATGSPFGQLCIGSFIRSFLRRSRAFTVYCAGLVSPSRGTCALPGLNKDAARQELLRNSHAADIGRASVRDTAVMQKSPQLRRRRY
jgi:hypothetical protein